MLYNKLLKPVIDTTHWIMVYQIISALTEVKKNDEEFCKETCSENSSRHHV